MCDEKKINLRALFAEADALAASLAGKVPGDNDEYMWRRRVWTAARPKLTALAALKDAFPADPEPLQGAFLLARCYEILLAGCIPPPGSASQSLSDYDNPYAEPDPLKHAAKYRLTHPGVDEAAAAYVAWRERASGLGAAEMTRVAEIRAEIARVAERRAEIAREQ